MADGSGSRQKPCPYEISGEEVTYSGPWLGLRQVSFVDPGTKKPGIWQIAYRTTTPKNAVADGIDIIPVLIKDGARSLILVKQYRIPVPGWTLEFPAGLVDAGESAREAGLRELKEETGFTATRVLGLSPSRNHLDPGMTPDSVNFITVEVDAASAENASPAQALCEGEAGMEVVVVPLDGLAGRLDAMAAEGVFVEAMLYTFALGMSLAK